MRLVFDLSPFSNSVLDQFLFIETCSRVALLSVFVSERVRMYTFFDGF